MPHYLWKYGTERGGKGLEGKCHVQLQKQMKGSHVWIRCGRNEGWIYSNFSYAFAVNLLGSQLCWSSEVRKAPGQACVLPQRVQGSCSAAEQWMDGGGSCLRPCLLSAAAICGDFRAWRYRNLCWHSWGVGETPCPGFSRTAAHTGQKPLNEDG